jgi:hypothetical protein
MEQDAEDRRQGHGRRDVAAGEGQLAEMGPADEVLEHCVIQERGHRDGGHREYRATWPPREQAADGHGDASRDERDRRPGQREPGQEAVAAAEGPDHRAVDGGVDPVWLCLPPDQEAECGDDEHARG